MISYTIGLYFNCFFANNALVKVFCVKTLFEHVCEKVTKIRKIEYESDFNVDETLTKIDDIIQNKYRII